MCRTLGLSLNPLTLLVFSNALLLVVSGWPSSWGNRPHRRAIPDDRNNPNTQIEDEEATQVGVPYAPSTYKMPLGMWTGPDQVPDESEDNMAAPNFHTLRNSKKTTVDTTFSTGMRNGPRHLRPSKVKRADFGPHPNGPHMSGVHLPGGASSRPIKQQRRRSSDLANIIGDPVSKIQPGIGVTRTSARPTVVKPKHLIKEVKEVKGQKEAKGQKEVKDPKGVIVDAKENKGPKGLFKEVKGPQMKESVPKDSMSTKQRQEATKQVKGQREIKEAVKKNKYNQTIQLIKNQLVAEDINLKKNKTINGFRGRIVRKREGRMSRDEQRRLMGELGSILKDDDEQKPIAKRIPPDVKREVEEYTGAEELPVPMKQETDALITGTKEESSSDENGKTSSSKTPSNRQAFDDWLREEYFRNMALSMATAKRKRNSPVIDSASGSLPDMRKKRKVDFDSDIIREDEPEEEENQPEEDGGNSAEEVFDPEVIQERLEVLENAVLTEAVEKIVEKARDTAMAEAARDQVAQMLAEAFYLERLQSALEDRFPTGSGQHYYWKQQQRNLEAKPKSDSRDTNWGNVAEERNRADWLEAGLDKRDQHGNLAEALNVMAPGSDDKREPDALLCPELRLLTSDCAGLEDVIPPDSRISYELQHVCNKHEVCYTCGEAFGLTSSSCDSLFLRETALLCRDDEACEPNDLNRLLTPLRERRVFYKRSIPPVCYRAHLCVGRFLSEP